MDANGITFYYQNCRGLRSKLLDLRLNILNSNYDIIIFTETWLRPGIFDSELMDDRYIVYRSDRSSTVTAKADGGGVLVAVHKSIKSTFISSQSTLWEELYVSIPVNGKDILVSAVYIPPLSPCSVYNDYCDNLEHICTIQDAAGICVVGDFNLPNISWVLQPNYAALTPVSATTNNFGEKCRKIIATCTLTNLKQYNNNFNCNNRLLDLLLCNNDSVIDVSVPQVILSKVDPYHPPFQFEWNLRPANSLPRQNNGSYNFRKANYPAIIKRLSEIDWVTTIGSLDANHATEVFYEIIYEIICEHVPLKKEKNTLFPKWFSPALKRTLKRKEKVWIKWKVYGSRDDYSEFGLLRARC